MLIRSADVVEHLGADKAVRDDNSRTLYPSAVYYPPSHTDQPLLAGDSAKAEAQRQGGVLLDADREVQFRYVTHQDLKRMSAEFDVQRRFLVGETGRKHSKLHPMVSPIKGAQDE